MENSCSVSRIDAGQPVVWNVHTVLIDELVCTKVGWEVLWEHALDGFIREYATTHACSFLMH